MSVRPLMARPGPHLPTWRWATLLGFALVGPISLPAGGVGHGQPELRRRSAGEPLLAEGRQTLSGSPQLAAPPLRRLSSGEPLRVLRTWRAPGGRAWLQVSGRGGRGWLALHS